jgi:hypothetical protein
MHRALQKAGYREVGRKRHYVFRGGVWHDAIIFELLRDDWLQLKRTSKDRGSPEDTLTSQVEK